MSGPIRYLTAALLAAGLVTFAIGCGKGEDGKPGADGADGANGSNATAASTPEETFTNAKAALEREDWKAFCGSMTPESQDIMAGGMAMVGGMMQAFAGLGGEEGAAAAKTITETMAKHGLTEEFLSKLQEGEKPEDELAAMKMVIEPVKDRGQFVADMMTAMKSMGDQGKKQDVPLSKDAALKNLKIDGDTAAATIEFERDGKTQSEPIAFKKVGGKWLMDMTEMMKKDMGGPPAGGPIPDGLPPIPGDAPRIPDGLPTIPDGVSELPDQPQPPDSADAAPGDESPKSDE